ncbi:unnamed protein product [Brugia timori]|uniref:Uncharacterized protein n=1 Tax=Brugia timori TaxID=42155 RepID=A0A3P7XFK2_9BILA|nr:unnamed protein product [Brugia timori]
MKQITFSRTVITNMSKYISSRSNLLTCFLTL